MDKDKSHQWRQDLLKSESSKHLYFRSARNLKECCEDGDVVEPDGGKMPTMVPTSRHSYHERDFSRELITKTDPAVDKTRTLSQRSDRRSFVTNDEAIKNFRSRSSYIDPQMIQKSKLGLFSARHDHNDYHDCNDEDDGVIERRTYHNRSNHSRSSHSRNCRENLSSTIQARDRFPQPPDAEHSDHPRNFERFCEDAKEEETLDEAGDEKGEEMQELMNRRTPTRLFLQNLSQKNDSDTSHSRAFYCNSRHICGLTLVCLVLSTVALGIMLGLFVASNPLANDSAKNAPARPSIDVESDDPQQEEQPKTVSDERIEFLQEQVADFTSDPTVLDDSNSPQGLALIWLHQDVTIDELKTVWADAQNAEQCKARYALAVLYYSTRGHQWTINNGFLTASSECEWVGITCDSNNHVIETSLENNNLYGTIPEEITALSHIQRLNFGSNQLYGAIPDLLIFVSLTSLDLSGNYLTGTIPTTIGQLSQLTKLNLSSNFLSSQLPWMFQHLANLEVLNLGDNDLTGGIDSQMIMLSYHLQELDLSGNAFRGQINFLHSLNALKGVNLSRNNFVGTIPSYMTTSLSHLTSLDVSKNKLSGTIPADLGSLTSLRSIQANDNTLSGKFPWFSFPDKSNMSDVWLGANSFEPGPAPFEELQRLGSVRAFDMSKAGLTGTIPEWIGNLTGLEVLDLSGNNLHGGLPSLGSLQGSLRILRLGGNNLSGSLPESIGESSLLEELCLHSNSFSGTLQSSLGNLSSLSVLQMQSNGLSGEIPQELGNIPFLRLAYFEENLFTGDMSFFCRNPRILQLELVADCAVCAGSVCCSHCVEEA